MISRGLSRIPDFHRDQRNRFANRLETGCLECLVCADDLYATIVERTLRGSRVGAANAMIIKPNQVGTISQARQTNEVAQKKDGIKTIVSHRSGETEDDSIGTSRGRFRGRHDKDRN